MQASSANDFPKRRNIAQEIAELSRERPGITEAELKAEGFTKEEIEENASRAAKLMRSAEDARTF
ncbi:MULTISPECIES: hypothetical protein [Rhizobium]|uniref:Uncharacterized protein n=1 Tax=Rhizobium tropici TaxID=398 RepID=A0A6P1C045_RHITR|nr:MULTISPECIES: hypothetical protein [Rhizobium]AGB71840.1 hypothetical protein RTCIAT899_CH12300 [Rhizobium tropici CIAT 899]MBB4243735.1 hypothetical protein [Rhizobium tropici]MBB5593290.1 hypothetical protein [Rhizobium tropici]MBB6494075.1 hypothetical protein [Rhizobium tropici]NEV09771.1 hypothetical protein [Rhizobium tropici]